MHLSSRLGLGADLPMDRRVRFVPPMCREEPVEEEDDDDDGPLLHITSAETLDGAQLEGLQDSIRWCFCIRRRIKVDSK